MSNLHTVLFLFLREHLWDPPGASFVIFQHCHYHFQHTDADIQLHTQFPGHNLLIRVDELIELFFVPQVTAVHGCPKYGSSFTSLLPPTTSLCSHPLDESHKHSANINECHFFSAWRNSIPHLCFICTCISHTLLSDLPSAAICCTIATCNVILVGRFNLYCHTTNICL